MFAKWFGYAVQDELQQPHVLPGTSGDAARPACLSEFASWLLAAGERDRICCAHLRTLYAEFALFTDTEPLSNGRLFRGLKAAGVSRHREGIGKRRWYYTVRQSREAHLTPEP